VNSPAVCRDQLHWERSMRVFWLWDHGPTYDKLQNKLEQAIVDGRVPSTELHRSIVTGLKKRYPWTDVLDAQADEVWNAGRWWCAPKKD